MKNLTKVACVTALALALAACGKPVDNAAGADNGLNETALNETAADGNGLDTNNQIAAEPAGNANFANEAAASDAFEIATSKLAATKASNAEVKKFAADMIKAHTDSTAKLKKAAASATPAVTPDPTLPADKQAKVDALGKLSGAEFDKAYAAEQVTAHTETLQKLQDYANNGDVAPLKSFATETVPVVQHHLEMANKLPK